MPTVIASPPEDIPRHSPIRRAVSDFQDPNRTPRVDESGMETSSSKWKMPFGRKASGKKVAQADDWCVLVLLNQWPRSCC